MAIWLPLFGGAAMAESLVMQMNKESCNEVSSERVISHAEMGEHYEHHVEVPNTKNDSGSTCTACGVCHIACTGYLAVTDIAGSSVQMAKQTFTPYLVSFYSITSAPLIPPPLVRA